MQHLNYKGFRRREKEKKESEKIFEEIIVENFSNMEKEIATQVQEAKSLIQDKPQEKHIKTHINQMFKKIKTKKMFKKTGRGKEKITYKGIPIRLSTDFSPETLQARGSGYL